MSWEIGTEAWALPCVKQLASESLLCSVGSSARCSVGDLEGGMWGWEGGLKEKGCVYTYS